MEKTIFTCNECGKTKVVKLYGSPKGWAQVTRYKGKKYKMSDYCEKCSDKKKL